MSEEARANQPTTKDADRIAQLMRGLGNLARSRMLTEALVTALAAFSVGLLAAVLLLAFVPAAGWLRLTLLVLWLAATAAVIWWRSVRFFAPLRQALGAARAVQDHHPELRSDVTASLQFAAELGELRETNRVSVAMVEQLIGQTRSRLEDLSAALPRAVPTARLKRPAVTFLIASLGVVAVAVFQPGVFERGLFGLLRGEVESVVDEAESIRRLPLLADINLSYAFPVYTRIGQRKVLNTTGDIDVLAGTEVTFEAVAVRPLNSAELVIDYGEGDEKQSRIKLERRPGQRVVARFAPAASGKYTVMATLEDGTVVTDGIERPILVRPDDEPRVTILEPEGEVDVAPQDVINFRYEASDDFGLTELAIVTMFAADESTRTRETIVSFDEAADVLPGDARPTDVDNVEKRASDGSWELDLLALNLQPRDQLIVYLEAVDNDSIAGPKVTTSEAVMLRVSSPEDKHQEILEDEEELVEALVILLADYLESPIGEPTWNDEDFYREDVPDEWDEADFGEAVGRAEPPHAKATTILQQIADLRTRMEQDPLMLRRDYELFSATEKELGRAHDLEKRILDPLVKAAPSGNVTKPGLERLITRRGGTVTATEKSIIRLQDLLASQRMESALDTAKSLKDAKERLKDLLEKYKETQDPALKAEIMREIQRLKQRMQELLAKLASQVEKLPREHVNLEALERDEMTNQVEDVGDMLAKLQEMLEKDDIDGALQALENLSNDIDDMLANMEEEFDEAQPEGINKLDKAVSEMMDQLNDLAAQEQEIAKETDDIAEKVEERAEKELEQMLEQFTKEELAKVEEIQQQLENIDRSGLLDRDQEKLQSLEARTERLKRALEQGDVFEALNEASELNRELDMNGEQMSMRSSYMNPRDPRKTSYDSAGKGMKRATPKAAEIENDLQQLLERATRGPNGEERGRLDQLAEEQRRVRQRLGEMRGRLDELGGEFPMLKSGLEPGLDEADQFMEGAERRLGEGEGRRAHDNEKMALDKLAELKKQLRESLSKGRMNRPDRGRRVSTEKVEIPDEDKSAPKAFREDIMDAMKEGALDDYESELREYYKSIVR